MENKPLTIEIDIERRRVRIAGVNYSFEFFQDVAMAQETEVYRFKKDFQSDTVQLRQVVLVKDVA